MAGMQARLQMGPDTVEVTVPVVGGQLLEIDPTATVVGDQPMKVRPASAGSKTAIGVAGTDGAPRGSAQALNFAPHEPLVPAHRVPSEAPRVKFAAATAAGQLVIAAANGQVTPYVSGTSTHDQIVGRCTQPGGVVAGATGRIRLYI